ncbi:(deoxy)nucleoside triphosphate pyrophosphohydrolase [Cyclobacterium salsum]|uniref:(deoxy)nucleoside triphosphate pyrophosphohydrolase n=1 Tax=Cyclobacterium salsum TaxID=2666329 RepID=UPI001391C03E|nr:(deoxy)nucleoside triphosphate pyrophosphohydrolase [Cyclobacterium salsum]
MIKVTCALIERNGETLVVQRSEKMQLPLKWEFPGGKMEVGESEEDCILREIKEELNIDIKLVHRLTPSAFKYPTKNIYLIPFLASHIGGELKLAEHKSYKWLRKDRLTRLDWAEADIPIMNEYLKL